MQTVVFEALGDPIRARIVELLADRDLEAGAIASRFDVSRPAVSRHLRVLREAGVVSSRGEATKRVYSLRPESLVELVAWTEKIRRINEARLDALGKHLDRMEKEGK
jgi:DNA-binding transcriptional ArsR family regulator